MMLSRRSMATSSGAAVLAGLLGSRSAFAQTPSAGDAAPWVTRAVVAPGLEQVVFASEAARTDVSFHVLSPPGLEGQDQRRFPTLYWLHGTGGATASVRPMAVLFARAMRTGQMPPAFVVFPNGLGSSLWCNSRDGSKPVETVFMREIIPLVDGRFRTVNNRSYRVIEGFSMGGFGAGRLGFRYPETFAAISMLGAGPLQAEFTIDSVARSNRRLQPQIFADVFGSDQAYFRAESPRGIARLNADRLRQGLRLRIAIGEDDFTLPANREFSEYLSALSIPHAFNAVPGVDHNAPRLFDALGFDFHRGVLPAAR